MNRTFETFLNSAVEAMLMFPTVAAQIYEVVKDCEWNVYTFGRDIETEVHVAYEIIKELTEQPQ